MIKYMLSIRLEIQRYNESERLEKDMPCKQPEATLTHTKETLRQKLFGTRDREGCAVKGQPIGKK